MLVAIQTPEQVDQDLKAEAQKKLDAERNSQAYSGVVDNLARHVRAAWNIAKTDRHRLDHRLLECLRRQRGEYSASKLEAIREMGASDIYMMITSAKCRSAKAWLADLFAPAGDRPFTLNPSAIPDLPPDMTAALIREALQGAEELGVPKEHLQALLHKHRDRLLAELHEDAEERAENMAVAIEDLLLEAGWVDAFDEFLDDLVTYPAAVMKGLEFRKIKTLKWMNEGGKFVPGASEKIAPRVRRVSPFRAYPSPSAGSDIQDHWFIEHHTLSRADLASMREAPGYNSEGIAQALLQYGKGGLKEWLWTETERAELEGRSSLLARTDEIDALEYSGSLAGQTLLDWGMDPREIPDPQEEYSVSVMIVGNHVIRALVNPDPAGKLDYFKACWKPVPGSFWGTSLPELLKDCQDTCNAAARALINNMGMASGPMVWVEDDRITPGTDVANLHPWKVIHSNSSERGSSSPGVGFFQPQSNAQELMSIYERFNRYADDITGMPSYAQGSDNNAGAAKTASGLSMLMNAASKTIKQVVRNIDVYVIERIVEKCYNHLMLTSSDETIKGDATPKSRGSESLVHKEQAQLRQQELLGITANPVDMEIIGLEGRREMLSEVLKTGDIPVDRILPTKEKLKEKLMAQAKAAQAPNAQ